jgi:hypothetical protein
MFCQNYHKMTKSAGKALRDGAAVYFIRMMDTLKLLS